MLPVKAHFAAAVMAAQDFFSSVGACPHEPIKARSVLGGAASHQFYDSESLLLVCGTCRMEAAQ